MTNGRALFQHAARNADYELILMSDAIDHPNVSETLQMFRRDPRTAKMPVGIMGPPRKSTSHGSHCSGRSTEFSFPNAVQSENNGVRSQTVCSRTLAGMLCPHRSVSTTLRSCWTILVTCWKKPDNYHFYKLLRLEPSLEIAVRTPELTNQVTKILGLLGTPRAQQSLVEVASQNALPLPQRQAAAQSFDGAVKQRGLRLDSVAIVRQYDRYNASESLDRDTQQILSLDPRLDRVATVTRKSKLRSISPRRRCDQASEFVSVFSFWGRVTRTCY